MRKARDQPLPDGVAADCHHNRDIVRRFLGRGVAKESPATYDRDREPDELRCKTGEEIRVVVREPAFDTEVLTLHVPEGSSSSTKGLRPETGGPTAR